MGGGSFGKVLILSFRDDEEYIINRILSCMNRETEILHQGDVPNGQLYFEGLYIDEQKRIVVRENNEIELTYTEFEILLLLAQNIGKVFSKEQIYDRVWKEPYFGDHNIVMSHIRNLREKIEDNPSKPVYIQTVWGVGYRFNKNLSSGQYMKKYRSLLIFRFSLLRDIHKIHEKIQQGQPLHNPVQSVSLVLFVIRLNR